MFIIIHKGIRAVSGVRGYERNDSPSDAFKYIFIKQNLELK
jgi:hypothetical protein